MRNNRFVIDTNVLVSALLFKQSVPFQVVKRVETEIILYSESTLYELIILNPFREIKIMTPTAFLSDF